MENYNTAFIQDEILMNVLIPLECSGLSGPLFVHSLGTLVEALILHEKIFFDPLDDYNPNNRSNSSNLIYDLINQSDFIKSLRAEHVLESPKTELIFESFDPEYDYYYFQADYKWMAESNLILDSDEELNYYNILLDLIKNIPQVFYKEELVINTEKGDQIKDDEIEQQAYKLGFTVRDILTFEAYNRRARAYDLLARALGSNLYLQTLFLPHKLSRIRVNNSKAINISEQLNKKIKEIDENQYSSSIFNFIDIPPLLQIVLRNCNDNPNALFHEIMELRHKHAKFRNYLTEYERSYANAKTRKERLKLQVEFNNAWEAILIKNTTPKKRIIYHLWEIVKDPKKILEKSVDKLAEKGIEKSIIGKARGLHDYWNELSNSPTPEKNLELISKLFKMTDNKLIWSSAGNLYKELDKIMDRPV